MLRTKNKDGLSTSNIINGSESSRLLRSASESKIDKLLRLPSPARSKQPSKSTRPLQQNSSSNRRGTDTKNINALPNTANASANAGAGASPNANSGAGSPPNAGAGSPPPNANAGASPNANAGSPPSGPPSGPPTPTPPLPGSSSITGGEVMDSDSIIKVIIKHFPSLLLNDKTNVGNLTVAIKTIKPAFTNENQVIYYLNEILRATENESSDKKKPNTDFFKNTEDVYIFNAADKIKGGKYKKRKTNRNRNRKTNRNQTRKTKRNRNRKTKK